MKCPRMIIISQGNKIKIKTTHSWCWGTSCGTTNRMCTATWSWSPFICSSFGQSFWFSLKNTYIFPCYALYEMFIAILKCYKICRLYVWILLYLIPCVFLLITILKVTGCEVRQARLAPPSESAVPCDENWRENAVRVWCQILVFTVFIV